MKRISTTLLNKINSKIQTPGTGNEPKMKVLVSRAKTVVTDSSYWTVEEMRTGTNLTDTSVAIRRLKPYGSPDRFYNSYVDGGKIRTAIREYPDYDKQKWQYQFEIGTGTATSVCFNGHWEKYRKRWQLVTEENPYIFWVDNSRTLWVAKWGEWQESKGERFELAKDVVSVKTIRAWKSIGELDKDMGLVCAYIKINGKAYYRNLCEQENGDLLWEQEREIGDATSLNLFLTNDYRLGVALEKASGIQVLLTARNWGGMAIAPDTINVAPIKIEFKSTEIKEHTSYAREKISIAPTKIFADLGYTLTDNKIIHAENKELDGDWGKIIDITIDHNLYNVFNGDFEISGGERVYPDKIEKISDKKYRLTFEGNNDFNNVGEVATIRFLGKQTTNAISLSYDPFEFGFNPINLIPREKPTPKPFNIKIVGEEALEIEFDLPLIGDLMGNELAFNLSGNDYLYVHSPEFNGEIKGLGYSATNVSRKNDTTLILTLPDLHRLSGETNLNYNQTLGSLTGEQGVVNSFDCNFINTIKPRNPANVETLAINQINVELISREIEFASGRSGEELLEVAPIEIKLVSTEVDVVDP